MDVVIRLLNALLMIAVPLVAGMFLIRRWGLSWRLFFIGAGTFIGSQVLHIPFNQLALIPFVETLEISATEQGGSRLLFGLIFGLSAGIFEEGARYIVYRLWLKDVRSWEEAVLYGAGHGGVEAILLGGLALFAFFQAMAYRNANLSELVPPEQLEVARAQLEAYWSAPWYAAILGAAERSLAVVIQISLAVMVLQAVIRRNAIWLGLSVLWHMVIDAVAVFGIQTWGVYLTEGALLMMTLASLGLLLALRSSSPLGEEIEGLDIESPSKEVPPRAPSSTDLTEEQLENTRFSDGV